MRFVSCLFFFKQKTAYEMRISDWSSDVCSSDLLTALEPDVVLISLENPSRDTLEESFLVSRSLGKPIAMFVDQSDEESTNAAVDAGVSAYIVDGFKKERIKPILDLDRKSTRLNSSH